MDSFHASLRSIGLDSHRILRFRQSQISTETPYSLPGAHDLLTSVPMQINDCRLFDCLGFRYFNLSPFTLLCISRPTDTYPLGSNNPDSLWNFHSLHFGNLKFQSSIGSLSYVCEALRLVHSTLIKQLFIFYIVIQ
jgi:hypothetical protein